MEPMQPSAIVADSITPPLWPLRQAVAALDGSGVVAHPTEAVFGLAARADAPDGVAAILRLKGRSVLKGFIVIAASLEQIEALAELPTGPRRAEVLATWPGPWTWLLAARPRTPGWLTGGRDVLAVRLTAHPLSRLLCAHCGPLVSTSANPNGRPPARSALMVRRYFPGAATVVLSGALGGERRPTRIVDARTGVVIRA